MTIDDIWTSQEKEIDELGGDEWLARRLVPDARCDVRIAVDHRTRSRAILVRLKKSVFLGADEFPRARGFEVRVISLPGDGTSHRTVAVVLTDRTYVDIFTVLANDITSRLNQVDSEAACFAELLARLRSWRRFMESADASGLAIERRRGLYGELYLLRYTFIPSLGTSQAVTGWLGPSRLHQDFQFGHYAIEVKTTTGKQHQFLQIASERQLDQGTLNGLFLFHLSLDARVDHGENLVQMIEAVRERVGEGNSARECLELKLLEAGYLDAHAPQYLNEAYSLRDSRFFRVGEGFPRIVESDLRVGVGDVHYSISVAECMHHQIPEQTVLEAIRSN